MQAVYRVPLNGMGSLLKMLAGGIPLKRSLIMRSGKFYTTSPKHKVEIHRTTCSLELLLFYM